ncbi:hypothetical protein KY290_036431 [Solanum tuberosum]|uniref:Uncharacterized protein n=1 Tax=Solanum tuberosum TaxID=4113 RepID=A0ABQ7TSN9_SOLTU|nr:hypothetical protein KY284_035825 [Solanum tuberosum]KAH0636040.1 hypothetical protein KY289_035955 [Solanum tuberosum]KAH0639155.1 hypothetical protein KY285_035741 [Solanum tuberosum]KAH0737726.1 hypothetical protein KY290_036431 [Solanum tuberosum]
MERNPRLLLWNLQKGAAPARTTTPAAFPSPTLRRNVQELRRHPPGRSNFSQTPWIRSDEDFFNS